MTAHLCKPQHVATCCKLLEVLIGIGCLRLEVKSKPSRVWGEGET